MPSYMLHFKPQSYYVLVDNAIQITLQYALIFDNSPNKASGWVHTFTGLDCHIFGFHTWYSWFNSFLKAEEIEGACNHGKEYKQNIDTNNWLHLAWTILHYLW